MCLASEGARRIKPPLLYECADPKGWKDWCTDRCRPSAADTSLFLDLGSCALDEHEYRRPCRWHVEQLLRLQPRNVIAQVASRWGDAASPVLPSKWLPSRIGRARRPGGRPPAYADEDHRLSSSRVTPASD